MTIAVAQTGQFWQFDNRNYLQVTAIGSSRAVNGSAYVLMSENNSGTVTFAGSQTLASRLAVGAPTTVATNSNALFDIKLTWGTASPSNTLQVLGAALYLEK